MKVGEKAILTCKPDYAYGEEGNPPNIPADATLTFEVELLSCEERQGIINVSCIINAADAFKEGTCLVIPIARDDAKVRALGKQRSLGEEEDEPGFVDELFISYCTLEGETCADVATKLGCGWRDVAIANKSRYSPLKDAIIKAQRQCKLKGVQSR